MSKIHRINTIRYPEDIKRFKKILNERGWDANEFDINEAYELFSTREYSASWMNPEGFTDDEIFDVLKTTLEEM